MMNVRFQKKTARGEVAILSRKDYEALVAKAAEATEDDGTARLVVGRAVRSPLALHCSRSKLLIVLREGRMPFEFCVSGAT